MKRQILWTGIVSLLIGLILGGAVMVTVQLLKKDQPAPTIDDYQYEAGTFFSPSFEKKLSYIKTFIDAGFLFDTEADYENEMLHAFVNSYGDPYTVYYTPEEYQDLMISTTGSFSGIGMQVQQSASDYTMTVTRVFRSSPAEAAGMKKGDIIVGVDGEDVVGMDLNLVVSKIRGEEGTAVTVRVYRESTDEYIDLSCVRAVVQSETVVGEMKEGKIGYMEVNSFDDQTDEQFASTYQQLRAAGMQGLIIDLRNNGGGLLQSSVNMLDFLLPQGTITYTVDKAGNQTNYRSYTNGILDIPCVLLVNEFSASASEIFTGAMKDYEKAVIVGETTFGKGIVQSIIPLGDGSAIKMTTSRYYTPSGVCIHEIGIDPDVEAYDDPETEEDEVLLKGMEVIWAEFPPEGDDGI